jgi:hypothetical protein
MPVNVLAIALLFALPWPSMAQTPPGVHRAVPPAVTPMQAFVWRDDAAGYTFMPPPNWASGVRAEPLGAAALAKSGATSGVDFRYVSERGGSGYSLLVLLATDEARAATLLRTQGIQEVARHEDHVIATQPIAPPTALGGEDAREFEARRLDLSQLRAAIRWDMPPMDSVR